MKTRTIVLWWVYAALAAAITYLFCTVTCAPVKQNNVGKMHDACTVIVFVAVLLIQVLQYVRKRYYKRQIIR